MTAQAATDTRDHCAYCGLPLTDGAATPERFGERFCGEAHAEEFVAGVRAARMQGAAQREPAAAGTCTISPTGRRASKGYVKRSACWSAPLLLLIAVPLFWSGGAVAAAGGSLLGVLALLACPLGMYFMMRSMGNMSHTSKAAERGETEAHSTHSRGEREP